MGKKNKSKVSGSVKTALKTEKKINAKHKKELTALGEDDIEKIVAEIEKEEARRQRIVEVDTGPPSRRLNFTLTAHPFKDELIMFGGEFHDGRQTIVYGDMFIYNLNKRQWSIIKAPGAPPPRCSHQAVATTINKGELWIFGGEFSSPSESQFYHYRDLWVFRLGEKKWEKIMSPGGPSARSGHRMTYIKKQLIVFGGFHDNLKSYKYFNDVYIFNLETYTWQEIVPSGCPPAPRSGCIILPTPDNKLVVYSGYSKEKIKKDVDKGVVHADMFLLSPNKNDETGLKWKWIYVKQTGIKVSPRCSASSILIQPNLAYIFGGVFDEEVNEEELCGIFYNDLFALDLEKFQWHSVTLCGKKDAMTRRRKKKPKYDSGNENNDEKYNNDVEDDDNGNEHSSNNDDESTSENVEQVAATLAQSAIADDDGIFTVTVGPAPTKNMSTNEQILTKNVFSPSPRIKPGLAVKHNVLYLYGGMVEIEDRQYTLNDFYSLDCRKLDEWKTIIKDDCSLQPWFESSSSDSDDSDDNYSIDDNESCHTGATKDDNNSDKDSDNECKYMSKK